MRIFRNRIFSSLLIALPLLMLTAGGAAWAETYKLWADAATVTLPDGKQVPVWGFGLDGDGDFGTPDYEITVPGPVLDVPFNDPGLTIEVKNMLPEAISLHILGQRLSNNGGPVWDGGASGSRPAGDVSSRIRSFSHETSGNGGMGTYTWSNFKPGTYMVQSGTHPSKQVQMGLYAAVKKDAGDGMAYNGVPYDNEMVIVYHEFDSVIHDAIAAGTYGTQNGVPSSIFRKPDYFLVNGKSYDPDKADGGGLKPVNANNPFQPGQKALLRFVNAGYQTHIPTLLGDYMTLVAEDGAPYDYPKERYGFELAAAKTMDAIYEPDMIGMLPLFDGRLKLSNAGSADGGMLAYLGAAPALEMTEINFNRFPVMPYDPAVQDGVPGPTSATVEDDGATLRISGNAWKKVMLPGFEITEETLLEFEMMVITGAEIHGIGFDNDDTANNAPNGLFQLAGSQTWADANQDFNTYSGNSWQSFSIPVGQYYTGPFAYLTFSNDDDGAPRDAETLFRNVRIKGLTAITPPDSQGPSVMNAAVSPNPTEGAANVTLTADADDYATGNSAITAAEWWAGTDPGQGNADAMSAADGMFNAAVEALTASIDVSGWAVGAYTIHIRAMDENGNWGNDAQVALDVTNAAPSDTEGPIVMNAAVSPNPTEGAVNVVLTADADDSATGNSTIASAEWWTGADPGQGLGNAMNAADGTFNSALEGLTASIDVSGWAAGAYTLNLRASDAAGNWSAPVQAGLDVTEATPVADTITITRAWYQEGRDRIVVFAESSDQPTPDLTVTALDGTGTQLRNPFNMNWNATQNRYQRVVNRFAERWTIPVQVLVESSGGGSAIMDVEVRP